MESIFFIKLMGYYMFLNGLIMLVSKEARQSMVRNIKNDVFIAVIGIITILFGLPFIILHNIWELNILGLVTFLGWSTVLKGVITLAKPSLIKQKEYSEKTIKIRAIFGLLIGLSLMYCGYYPYFI
mgnify:FL=1